MTATAERTSAPESQATDTTPSQEGSGGGFGGLFQRLFGSGERTQPSTPTDTPSTEGETTDDFGNDAPVDPPPLASDAPEDAPDETADDWSPPTSREEEARRLQSLADKRDAKRQRDQEKADRERAKTLQNAQLQQLERAEEEALAEGDLSQVRAIRQQRSVILGQVRQGEFVQQMLGGFDTHMLLPLLEPLPQADQEQIVEAIQDMDPLPGRTHAVKEALTRLEKRFRADERSKTRKDLLKDDAFWREVRAARGMQDDEDEADLVQGTPKVPTPNPNEALARLIRGRR